MGDAECLCYLGKTQVNMGPDSYHYIATKVLQGPIDADSTATLAALVAHRQFRDDYVGLGSSRLDSVDKHGPYLARVSADSFRPVQKDRATRLVRARTEAGKLVAG